MVVRRSVLDSGLAEEWSRMFCEDAYTNNYLRRHGLKLACVPQATVVNSETTTFLGCVNFVNRQMLIFRLYHRQWPSVVAFILFVATLRFLHYFFILLTLIYGEWISCLVLIGVRPVSLFVTQFEAIRLDQAVRTMLGKSGQKIAKNPVPEFLGYLCAEALFLTSMLNALGTRFVSWRGIKYQINGPTDIVMLAYQPYFENFNSAEAGCSTIV